MIDRLLKAIGYQESTMNSETIHVIVRAARRNVDLSCFGIPRYCIIHSDINVCAEEGKDGRAGFGVEDQLLLLI